MKVGAGIGVLLLRDGKVLFGKRNDDPEKASSALSGEGTWTMPGGKMEFGESFEECARREVEEETGIKLNSAKVINVSHYYTDKAHYVCVGLLSDDFEGEPRIMEPDEITEWKWFPIEEPPKNIFPPSEQVLKDYQEEVFYKY